ncbi:M48 family metalloprotease [Terriglobus sp. 2YAB30_2]|uniref:M48 family metalloprotease n=1 Tax=Terriglobus sp. 2YAB30_2 TaxID=3233023 RepID=UPI003F9BEA1D
MCLVVLTAFRAGAQDVCLLPSGLARPASGNMFTDEQENMLGDVMADWIEHREALVKDAAESAYLEKIGARLLAVLPPTGIKFRFLLVDSSEINGFSLAGGRVYLTRKLVATAHNEDEVAGVLAHEIGHIVTHQSAAEVSERFRRLLKINTVTDRADIYEKFVRGMDVPDSKARDSDSDADQAVADSIALYAMAKAGYAPTTYAEFWDRSFFVEGKTGSGWSDFFHMTKPSQKRLRSLRAMASSLPPGCGAKTPSVTGAFKAWQAMVIANQRTEGTESAGTSVTLEPALRMDLDNIRYSPDGKYLLAQDESSIFVLNTATRKLLFRFDADEAWPAMWSPDSKRIVFHTPKLHIEEWDVEQQKLRVARELVTRNDCVQTALSPDGRTLICVAFGELAELTVRLPFDLYLLDTESSQQIFVKKDFASIGGYTAYFWSFLHALGGTVQPVYLAFSQDGNTVVLGNGVGKLAFDLRSRSEIPLGGDFKNKVSGPFAFQASGIAGIDFFEPKNSGLFSFPDGHRISKASLNVRDLASVSSGDLVSTLGKDDSRIVLDFKTEQGVLRTKATFDIHGENVAIQGVDGGIELGTIRPEVRLQDKVGLPLSPLASLRVMELSPDGKFLALSGKTRGGVWNVTSGKQIYNLHGYTGVAFHKDGSLYLDLPKREKSERSIFKLQLDQSSITKSQIQLKDEMRVVAGKLLEWKTAEKNKSILSVKDVASGEELWTRTFGKQSPYARTNVADGNFLLIWNLGSNGGKAELQAHPELSMQAAALKERSNGLILELLNADDGKLKQSVVLERPRAYDGPAWVYMVGDAVLIETSDHRTLIYSVKTGAMVKQVFGYMVAADSESGLFCIRNRSNEALVYDLTGIEKAHVNVGSTIRFARLRDNGHKLLLLGADQKLRSFDLTAAKK